jgi:mRNA-degrading endonuclease RelE of RelBE toxin-antitoxin system
VGRRLLQLCDDPFDRRVSKPLKGPLEGQRSSDLNNLRIIYEVDDTIRVLDVIDIGPRGDIYKR